MAINIYNKVSMEMCYFQQNLIHSTVILISTCVQ
jgi:hypothetical protein